MHNLWLIDSGSVLSIDGGWLLCRLTYWGMLPGFVNGLYVPVRKSKVISKKSTTFLLASIVNFRLWSLNILHISFLIFSVSLGVSLNAPKPSSLYRPSFRRCCCLVFDKRKDPTSSQVSAPSNEPMVTSNCELVSFLHHASFSLNNNDLFAWMMICFSSSVISSNCAANSRASVSSCSEIDG